MNKYQHTQSIIQGISQKTDSVIMYHSIVGKDSIALLDMISGYFDRVVCVFMYLVPNLRHINEYMQWALSKYKNVEFIQVPHLQRYAMKKHGLFCYPDSTIQKVPKIGEIEQRMRDVTGIHYAFSGMKGVDGYMKRMRLKKFARDGYVTEKGMVYPLALWTNREVLAYISSRRLLNPFVYQEGVPSQGLTAKKEVIESLRSRYPDDYIILREDFPFIEKLLYDDKIQAG